MDGERLLTAEQISTRLQEIAPSASWLKYTSVERLLSLPRGTISAFLTSIQPEQRGSRRRQTRLSDTQRQLERAGLFFKNGHVAVDKPGNAQPHWGGVKYSDIAEPILRSRVQSPVRTTSDGQVRAGLPSSSALADSPVGSRGRSPADPHDDSGSDKRESEGEGTSAAQVSSRSSEEAPASTNDEPQEWSADIAVDPVFQALISTDTNNHFLLVEDLAQYIDEGPTEIRRILKEGEKWRRTDSYTSFLRAFGIIPREHGNRMSWCLLGIGAVQMSLGSSDHIEYVMTTEPRGYFFGPDSIGTGNLRANGPSALPHGFCPFRFFQESMEFAKDIMEQTKCRRCEAPVRIGEWAFVRRESLASPFLRPRKKAEVGIAFRCQCGAVHLDEPLPERSQTGELWSSADSVVEVMGQTCPIRESVPEQLGRGRRDG